MRRTREQSGVVGGGGGGHTEWPTWRQCERPKSTSCGQTEGWCPFVQLPWTPLGRRTGSFPSFFTAARPQNSRLNSTGTRTARIFLQTWSRWTWPADSYLRVLNVTHCWNFKMDVCSGTRQFGKDVWNITQAWDFIINCIQNSLQIFQRVVELSPKYTHFSVLLLNYHQSTHLSACCYWTVILVHTFQRVVIAPFSVLLLHLSACCYYTFQRVAVTFWSWSVTDVGFTRPITSTEVWPPRPSCYISMTPRAQSVTDIWPCGPIQLHKHDLVGPTSYTSMTLWAQPITEVWPGPNGYRSTTFRAQPLQKYGTLSLHRVGDRLHSTESTSYNYNYPDILWEERTY